MCVWDMNASHSGSHIQIWSHGMTLYHDFMRHLFWTLCWRDEIVEVTALVASLLYIRYQSKFITGCCFVSKNFDTLLPPANEVWGKVIFLPLSVGHSVHGGGEGCLPGPPSLGRHPLGRHPPRQTPPGQTPSGRQPLQADTPQADNHYSRQIPPIPHEMATEAGSTHPTGMHSCLCSLI